MTDALDRLRAGLDTDERIARAASPSAWRPDSWQNEQGREFLVVADETVGAPAFAISNEGNAEHIARQDPRTSLRRVEAIRKVLEVCDAIDAASLNGEWREGHYGDRADDIREALAGIYAEEEP